jgi:sialate O-acetylesterase
VGTWHYRVESALELRSAAGGQPIGPCELYNAMIHPLLPFPICGALWYQGESNADRADQYRTLLPTMISAWRSAWNHTTFPFYIVQLANFQPPAEYPGESTWAELREAQALAQTALPEVYTISAIDVGDAYDIHPTDKQSVARRLAHAALATHYGRDLPWRHPSLKRATFSGAQVRIELADARGLHVRGEKILGFALCGEDRKWHWGDARLETPASPSASPAIVVTSPAVPHPIALRYAWHENPPSTLFNAAGLPVLPFRTDSFPAITAGRT